MPQTNLPVQYIHPLDRNVILGNLLLGLVTGSPERMIGGAAGGLWLRRMNDNPGPIGAYLRGLSGGNANVPPVAGSILGNMLGKSLESPDPKTKRGSAPASHQSTESSELKKESHMNTVEELFKTATEALEEKVFIPTVLSKLAERGYKAETREEAIELLKHAQVVRQGIASGEMAPIPMSQLDQNGQITKQAADAASQDFLAFAPEVEVDLKTTDAVVKEAAEVLAWGYMKSVKDQEAAAKK